MSACPTSLLNVFAAGLRELPPLPQPMMLRCDGTGTEVQIATVEAVLRLLPRKRLVVQAQLGGRRVAVKLFASNDGGERHRQRERTGAAALAEAGISGPHIIDGCSTPDGRYVGLLYAWLDGADDLNALWSTQGDEKKRQLLRTMLVALAKLHAIGARQTDIHLGNFMVDGDRIYLLDLGSIARQSAPLNQRASLANLAALAAQLTVAEQPFISDLLDVYCAARGWSMTAAMRANYERDLRAAWRVRWRDYRDKSLRDCSLTLFRQDFHTLFVCRRSRHGAAFETFSATPDAVIASGELLKAGNTATVVRARLGDESVVIKRYNIKNAVHALSRCWRPTRAEHSWICAHLLELLGVPALQPVALLEHRRGWLRGRAWFVSTDAGGENLLDVGARAPLTQPMLTALRRILEAMIAAGLSHGDFKATNFLVCDPGSEGGVMLIDLDAMRRHRTRVGWRRAFLRDLARLRRNWPEGLPTRMQIDALIADLPIDAGWGRL